MGTIVEHFADDKGLVWPKEISPFVVYLIKLGEDEQTAKVADETYHRLTQKGISVLYDDRQGASAGEMFADADLMGMPYRLVVSPKSLQEGSLELKDRTSTEQRLIKTENVIEILEKELVG
jgi:prolyl-tRNA synthetase